MAEVGVDVTTFKPHSIRAAAASKAKNAFPRMADNCTLARRSCTSSLPNQVFAPFDRLPRAPITIGIIMTFEAP